MATFVALLRGINVGKAKRLAMADLRSVLDCLGYTGVKTLLNSGNAVFRSTRGTSSRHAASIAAAIAEQHRLDVPVIVKSLAELTVIVEGNPLARVALEPSRLLIAFVQNSGTLAQLAPIGTLVHPSEKFASTQSAAYLHCAGGILESKAAAALLGRMGREATTRNWATVRKLHALASEAAD